VTDLDLMQQWARLVKVEPNAVIEITPVVVSAPEVQKIHDRGLLHTTSLSCGLDLPVTLFTVANKSIDLHHLVARSFEPFASAACHFPASSFQYAVHGSLQCAAGVRLDFDQQHWSVRRAGRYLRGNSLDRIALCQPDL
jgi:hypothetical protein